LSHHFFQKNRLFFIGIILLSAFLLYTRSWESLLRVIDDCRHATIAKNLTLNWNIFELKHKENFYLEKPPLPILLSALGQFIFGYNSFGAKFFISFLTLIGIGILFKFLLREYDLKYAFWGSFILITTQQILFYSRRVMSDGPFTIFLMLALICFFKGRKDSKYFLLTGFLTALAILCKGTIGLLFFLIIGLYIIFSREWNLFKTSHFYLMFFLIILAILPWHLGMYFKHGEQFIKTYFWETQLAYFFPGSRMDAMPWGWETNIKKIVENYWPWLPFFLFFSFKAFLVIKREGVKKEENKWLLFLLIWIFSILIIFQVAKTKRYAYILSVYPGMALLIGYFIRKNKKELLFRKIFISLALLYLVGTSITNSLTLALDDSAWEEHRPVLKFINNQRDKCGKTLLLYLGITKGYPFLTDGYLYYTGLKVINCRHLEELKRIFSSLSETPLVLTNKVFFPELRKQIGNKFSLLLETGNLILLKVFL
jgi:4-amino-4-deoxy-L-arabinose transferase-like glycosyltransferase